jgi:hypothetical protein
MRPRPCRRPIKMSPVCQSEMTLARGYPGGVWGDGSADERWRAAAARGSAGFGASVFELVVQLTASHVTAEISESLLDSAN